MGKNMKQMSYCKRLAMGVGIKMNKGQEGQKDNTDETKQRLETIVVFHYPAQIENMPKGNQKKSILLKPLTYNFNATFTNNYKGEYFEKLQSKSFGHMTPAKGLFPLII